MAGFQLCLKFRVIHNTFCQMLNWRDHWSHDGAFHILPMQREKLRWVFVCGYSSGWWMFQHLHVPLKNTWHPNHQDEQRFGRCLPFNGFTWRPGFAITLPKPWCLGSIFRNWFTSIDMPVYGRFLWRIPLWSGVCAPSVLPEPLLPTIGEMSWSRDGALTQPSWTVLSFNRLQS